MSDAKSNQAPVELGDRVKDPISGLVGIVICMTYWLNGCTRVIVQPEGLKDGSPIKDAAFDDTHLEIVDKQVFARAMFTMIQPPGAEPSVRSHGGPDRESDARSLSEIARTSI